MINVNSEQDNSDKQKKKTGKATTETVKQMNGILKKGKSGKKKYVKKGSEQRQLRKGYIWKRTILKRNN